MAMLRSIVTLALLAAAPYAAAASQDAPPTAPKLRELVTVTTDLVRIGDLVDNAGPAANIAVFRAPDLGQTGAVQVARVTEALKSHNVAGLDTAGLSEVIVTRLSRVITTKDIEERIAQALGGQHGFGDAKNLSIAFDREIRPMHVEAAATAELLIARMNVEPRTGRFDVSFEIPGSAAARRLTLRFKGTVTETVETATLVRAVGRGETIRESDVTMERRPKAEVAGEAIGFDEIVGLSAKRALRAGQAPRTSDLMKADVVQRNEAVTIVYEAPGILLTVRGKALEAGAVGDTIGVLNTQSNRTVHAAVSGPGQVVVTATMPRVAATVVSASDSNRRRRAQ
jgi:flagella basal body P-ring formation protein FlgA